MRPEIQIVVITLIGLAGIGACILLAFGIKAFDELMGIHDDDNDCL